MIDQLVALGPFQWLGLIFGLLYIFYAIKNNPICWLFGAISCVAIAIEDFTKTRLYADGFLQLFYVGISFFGLYKWKFGVKDKKPLRISRLSLRFHIPHLIGGLAISWIVATFISKWSNAAFPIVDSVTTIFSISTTFLLVYRILGNWIYWICIDLMYIFLYQMRDAPLFALLYIIFCIMAIIGYLEWRKEMRNYKNESD